MLSLKNCSFSRWIYEQRDIVVDTSYWGEFCSDSFVLRFCIPPLFCFLQLLYFQAYFYLSIEEPRVFFSRPYHSSIQVTPFLTRYICCYFVSKFILNLSRYFGYHTLRRKYVRIEITEPFDFFSFAENQLLINFNKKLWGSINQSHFFCKKTINYGETLKTV